MEKTICDRCGKEIKKGSEVCLYTNMSGNTYVVKNTPGGWISRYIKNKYDDLCGSCSTDTNTLLEIFEHIQKIIETNNGGDYEFKIKYLSRKPIKGKNKYVIKEE